MATILYVFPHPDDESFGPAPAIVAQKRDGHSVHLLTLTRGGATRQRDRLGLSVEEMGEVRFREMQCVREMLDLDSLAVLDFPDGGLDELDPADLEQDVERAIRHRRPDVVVTYAVHGISGHPDHLVCHNVAKRAFCKLRGTDDGPGRLAFFTIRETGRPERPAHLKGSAEDRIDAIEPVSTDDLRIARRALDCYETYAEVVAAHQPLEEVKDGVLYELFQEHASPPLVGLCTDLPKLNT
ncbi:MAG: PIG-L deacetylase family protein [Bacteroidota bacterium]